MTRHGGTKIALYIQHDTTHLSEKGKEHKGKEKEEKETEKEEVDADLDT